MLNQLNSLNLRAGTLIQMQLRGLSRPDGLLPSDVESRLLEFYAKWDLHIRAEACIQKYNNRFEDALFTKLLTSEQIRLQTADEKIALLSSDKKIKFSSLGKEITLSPSEFWARYVMFFWSNGLPYWRMIPDTSFYFCLESLPSKILDLKQESVKGDLELLAYTNCIKECARDFMHALVGDNIERLELFLENAVFVREDRVFVYRRDKKHVAYAISFDYGSKEVILRLHEQFLD